LRNEIKSKLKFRLRTNQNAVLNIS